MDSSGERRALGGLGGRLVSFLNAATRRITMGEGQLHFLVSSHALSRGGLLVDL